MKKKTDAIPMILVLVLVGLLLLPAFRSMALNRGGTNRSTTSGGDYFFTWEEYLEAKALSSWNWNDAAEAIGQVARHAAELYEKGDKAAAYEFAKAAYWGYYETTGFERNTMTYISGARVSAVELQFTTLRKAVKKDLGVKQVWEEAEALARMLHEDALTLNPEGAQGKSGAESKKDPAPAQISSGSRGATFAGSFSIILREGLEAILVVSAIIAYLLKTGRRKAVVPVYIGAGFAVVCSFAVAALLAWLKAINPETTMSQEIMEGFAALLAVIVLFYVSNWMVSKSEASVWEGYIQGKVQSSAESGNVFLLAFTAWLAVFREGAEVILFYQPMLSEGHGDMVWLGFAVGCAVLLLVFLLIRLLSIKLPLKPFFLATSFLMAFMTLCFLGAGVKELMEGGVFDDFAFMLASPPWLAWIPYNDVLDVFGIYPLVGTILPQLILLAITIVTFVIQFRRNRTIREQAEAAAAKA